MDYNGITRKIVSSRNKKDRYVKAEEYLIYIVTTNLAVREEIRSNYSHDDFVNETNSKIFELILNSALQNQELLDQLEKEEDRKLVRRIIIEGEEGLYPVIKGNEWIECLDTLRGYKRENYIKTLKDKIRQFERENRDDEVESLTIELFNLMNSSK
jgi:hypothetical protein